MRPFSNYSEPYFQHYTSTMEYNGAARDAGAPKPEDVNEVRIGFLGPVENHPDQKLGLAMLNGANSPSKRPTAPAVTAASRFA